jgi:hypothetical protein
MNAIPLVPRVSRAEKYPTRRPRLWGRLMLIATVILVGLLGSAVPAVADTPATPATGWIRFAHFAPSQGPVDIWVDGAVAVTDSSFKDVGAYISLAVGPHAVAVRPTGAPASTPAMATGTAVVSASTAITGAIVDVNGKLQLEMLNDDLSAPPAGDAKLRIIQSAPGLGSVSATLHPTATASDTAAQESATSALDIPDVAFASASPYLAVPTGTYQVAVTKEGESTTLVSGNNLPVTAGTVDSIVVLGAASSPTIEVLSDAVGATAMPIGGMHTGEGGTADGLPHPSPIWPSMVLALGSLVLVATFVRRRLFAFVG